MKADIRACFLGDSFTAGTGDESGLGWVGRLVAAAAHRRVALTAYDLGIRRDTSADILRRAADEVVARLVGAAGERHAVVFCFGANDCALIDDMPRVPPERTLEIAAELFAWAAPRWTTLVLGPPPVLASAAHDARVAALSARLGALCGTLGIAFLPLHPPLAALPAWRHGALRGDGVHPDGAGYAALAAVVDAWGPWRRLTGG